MSRLKGIAARLRSLVRPAWAERRMNEEFAFHVEMETARLQAEGLSRDEARRRALAHFGGVDRYREEMREGRRARWLYDVPADLRYGVRMLRKSPGLTLLAVASLSVGIGANAAVFSLLNAFLLRPRAVASPEQLVQIYAGDRERPYQTISYPSYHDFRERNQVFTGLAAYGVGWQFRLRGSEDTEPVWGEVVSGNYFDVLGVRAHRGRFFAPDEDVAPNRNPVVVIGHELWQRRFAADPAIIGRPVVINGVTLTVIGVAPPEYTGMTAGWASEIWVPSMMVPSLDPANGDALLTRQSKWLTLVGRLAPGVSIEQARSNVAALTRGLQAEQPDEWLDKREDGTRELVTAVLSERETRIHPMLRAPAYALSALLFGVVDVVLIIACLNLAGMLFARGVTRRTEIAVRLALGARRSRIIRQLLTESILVSLMAGAAGVALGVWALDALLAFMPALPEGIRVAIDVRLDWRVVLYTMAFATLAGMLFGLAPALHASRSALSSVLKDDAAALATRFRTSRSRRALVVGQIALSLLLLIGAGLMLRSLHKVRPTSLGFSSERMVIAPIPLDANAYDRQRAHQFYQRLSDDVAALPGVAAVSLVEGIPGGFMSRWRRATEIEGYASSERLQIDAGITGPGYFTNMRVPILVGRDFDQRDQDGAPCVAIVNEAFAQRYLGGTAAALGKHIASYQSRAGNAKAMCVIVGVIKDDAWQSLQREVRPFFALPLLQVAPQGMTLLVSTADNPAPLIAAVRKTIQALDPDIPVSDVHTLRDYFKVMAYPFRLLGLVLGGCGVMALLLATMGIYGTVSHAVAQRRREVGIRMALGAASSDILKLVVGEAMLLVGCGLGAGLLLGLLLTRALVSMPLDMPLLFGVSATDAATFAGVTLLLALVGLAACWVPALRASQVQPVVTLRSS